MDKTNKDFKTLWGQIAPIILDKIKQNFPDNKELLNNLLGIFELISKVRLTEDAVAQKLGFDFWLRQKGTLQVAMLYMRKSHILTRSTIFTKPLKRPQKDNQARIRDCVVTREPFVGNQLRNSLEAVEWPVFYLDFETVMTAIPLYPDIAPYTQLPTQYSILKCSDVSTIDDHVKYLADPSKDCRRELAESLIRDLEQSGSIIVYSTFEKTTINSLAKLYPDLSGKLIALTERMVDLEAIIRNNYYHPDFQGSTSIKRTLPVLVPEMTYDSLEIREGDSASAAFAYLALGRYNDTEAAAVERNLLDYCEQDTLAMVKLRERLFEFA